MISMRTWYAMQLGMLGVEDRYVEPVRGSEEEPEQRVTKPLIVHLAEVCPKLPDRRKNLRRAKREYRVGPAD